MTKIRKSVTPPQDFPDLPMLFAPLAASAFEELGVSVSTNVDQAWRALHHGPSVTDLELEHGGDVRRYRYNQSNLERARTTHKVVRGELFGLRDLFAPLIRDGEVRGVLVTGPYSDHWPTSDEIHARWTDLANMRARPSDPAFARYLETRLATLTLEGPLLSVFERMLGCFARLGSSQGDPYALAGEAEALRIRLLRARAAERMWEHARNMVDERTASSWSTGLRRAPLESLGMSGPPRHAIVGLVVSTDPAADPVATVLARYAFQRACTHFAESRGHVACGRIGDHGVTLLTDYAGSGARARGMLVELSSRVATLARRFGFRLHAGVAPAAPSGSLSTRYREALAAAEKALANGSSLEVASVLTDTSREGLRQLRRTLASGMLQPNQLAAHFDRYIEAVLAQTGHRLETVREQLQIGLEMLAEPLLAQGVLEPKNFDEICRSRERDHAAETVLELVRDYRRVLADVESSSRAPTNARHERSTRRALAFIQEHLDEALTRAQVAKVAGFAPDYFSRLLKEEEGVSFEGYLRRIRLDRARYLLTHSDLSVSRIAEATGFKSRTYFQRLFRETTGLTPAVYRAA